LFGAKSGAYRGVEPGPGADEVGEDLGDVACINAQ
jgi:hypothetical protein